MPASPPPPGRLSTTNCCPSRAERRVDSARATMSVPPPAANATTTRTGRSGYRSCANARDALTANATPHAAQDHLPPRRAVARNPAPRCIIPPAVVLPRSLLELDVRRLDDARVLCEIRLDQRGEFIRRGDEGLHALALQSLPDIRQGQHLRHLGVELVDDRTRRRGRREQSIPGGDLEALEARFDGR